jgi:Fe-S-cluster-containing dehydrogenase component/CRP-like cAMP-binding protein
MIEVTQDELRVVLEESDLFQELFQLPGASRYRQALQRAAAWRLETGETLPGLPARRGAYAVLRGSATLASDRPEGDDAGPASRRIFSQWSGLRGLAVDETPVALDPSIVLECSPELLQLLLGVANRFQVEFYAPLVSAHPSLADVPADVLETVIRRSTLSVHREGSVIIREGEPGNTMFFLLTGSAIVQVPGQSPIVRSVQDFFGEIALLSRQRRVARVSAGADCLMMECDRSTVATLIKKSKTFKRELEQRYRERAMLAQLQQTTFFQGLVESELDAICEAGTLETFEPYQPLFFQGDAADGLYILLNGAVAVVQETEAGPLPLAWKRAGDTVGEMALLPWVTGTDRRGQTVTALQDVEAIRIPAAQFERIISEYPSVREQLEATARKRLAANDARKEHTRRALTLGWMLETPHIAGSAVLAVDMNDCIRCNNCVTACESVHPDGLNRFFWSGMRQNEEVMPQVRLSNSCQHCETPLCMRNCPTNCIERDPQTGAVFIDHDRCIKCGTCADPGQGCPYGSIYTVPTEQVNRQPPAPLFQQLLRLFQGPSTPHQETGTKAGKQYPVKCDLCHGLPYEACVHHCPTGAVFRIDGGQQFSQALKKPAAAGSAGNAPQRELLSLVFRADFAQPPAPGRPSELVISVSDGGPGWEVKYRRPERGVHALVLNLYLSAPEGLRLGGGPHRQLILPVEGPLGTVKYGMTSRGSGMQRLALSLYQGNLYLGRIGIEAEFGAAARQAAGAGVGSG